METESYRNMNHLRVTNLGSIVPAAVTEVQSSLEWIKLVLVFFMIWTKVVSYADKTNNVHLLKIVAGNLWSAAPHDKHCIGSQVG